MNKFYIVIALALVSVFVLGSCTARNQVRFDGTLELGDLPADVKYIDGVPQIITVSTESNGDVVVAYYSDDNQHIFAQLYGCAYIKVTCDQLFKQGRYQWNIPSTK